MRVGGRLSHPFPHKEGRGIAATDYLSLLIDQVEEGEYPELSHLSIQR